MRALVVTALVVLAACTGVPGPDGAEADVTTAPPPPPQVQGAAVSDACLPREAVTFDEGPAR